MQIRAVRASAFCLGLRHLLCNNPSTHYMPKPVLALGGVWRQARPQPTRCFSLVGDPAPNVEVTGAAHRCPSPPSFWAGGRLTLQHPLEVKWPCFGYAGPAQKEASGERKRVCLAGVGARVWGTQQVLTHREREVREQVRGKVAGWALGDGFSGQSQASKLQ